MSLEPALKRLFFALWPDALTRQRCVDVQALLAAQNCLPVAGNNLHATLVFLGAVDQATELALIQAAASIKVSAIRILFNRLDFWSKPGVLCLTGISLDAELYSLVQALTGIAQQLGIAVDERPYQAHVTLARKAKKIAIVELEPILWQAQAFCLVESRSGVNGVEYRVCQAWGG